MAALGGAAVIAAAGAIVGAFVGSAILEFEATRHDAKIRVGNILHSVHTEDGKRCDIAKDVFRRNRAKDITNASEASVG